MQVHPAPGQKSIPLLHPWIYSKGRLFSVFGGETVMKKRGKRALLLNKREGKQLAETQLYLVVFSDAE